jgi:Glycine-zipper domain
MFVRWVVLLLEMGLLSACTIVPTGPNVLVLPAPGKPLEIFQTDEVACRQYAQEKIGVVPEEAATQSAVTSAAIGTAVGAAAGAVLGAAAGNAGVGAAIGAGSGLLVGGASGAQASAASGATLQSRYDVAYIQCMYSRGNHVPGIVTAPAPRFTPPPPPPGPPPLPPPGPIAPEPNR